MDVKAVGSDLTPAQQDEVIEDLAFFLDEFGSTQAVRVKLQAQERAVLRLERRLQRLLSRQSQSDQTSHEQEEKDANNEESATAKQEDVDSTMRDLDFFIKTFGSTRAVREKLQSQEKSIWSLQRLVEWLEQHCERMVEASGAKYMDSDLRELIPERGLPEAAKSDQSSAAEAENDSSDGARLSVAEGSSKIASAAQVDMGGCSGDVLMGSPQKEDELAEQESAIAEGEDGLAKRINVVPMETQGTVSAEHGKELRADDVSEHFRLQPITSKSYEGDVFANCGVVSPDSTEYQSTNANAVNVDSKSPSFSGVGNYSDLRDPVKPQEILTEDSSMAIESSMGLHHGVSSVCRTPKAVCSQPGCTKGAQRKGLCCRHGGYYICSVQGCSRRAVTQNLCPLHGGGTRCKVDGCDKLIVGGCSGYCRRHAPVTQRRQESQGYNQYSLEGERKAFVWGIGQSELLAAQSAQPFAGISYRNLQRFPVASPLTRTGRPSHTTCKALRCMKWVLQDGDPNEYCPLHRNASKSRLDSPTTPTLAPRESFIHRVGEGGRTQVFLVDPFIPEGVGDMNTNEELSLCRVPGCENVGKPNGAKKGFCFRHGGGVFIKHPGCTKRLQPKDVYPSPESFSKCKVEGCGKNASLGGMCSQHHLELAIALENVQHNSSDEIWTHGWPTQIHRSESR